MSYKDANPVNLPVAVNGMLDSSQNQYVGYHQSQQRNKSYDRVVGNGTSANSGFKSSFAVKQAINLSQFTSGQSNGVVADPNLPISQNFGDNKASLSLNQIGFSPKDNAKVDPSSNGQRVQLTQRVGGVSTFEVNNNLHSSKFNQAVGDATHAGTFSSQPRLDQPPIDPFYNNASDGKAVNEPILNQMQRVNEIADKIQHLDINQFRAGAQYNRNVGIGDAYNRAAGMQGINSDSNRVGSTFERGYPLPLVAEEQQKQPAASQFN